MTLPGGVNLEAPRRLEALNIIEELPLTPSYYLVDRNQEGTSRSTSCLALGRKAAECS